MPWAAGFTSWDSQRWQTQPSTWWRQYGYEDSDTGQATWGRAWGHWSDGGQSHDWDSNAWQSSSWGSQGQASQQSDEGNQANGNNTVQSNQELSESAINSVEQVEEKRVEKEEGGQEGAKEEHEEDEDNAASKDFEPDEASLIQEPHECEEETQHPLLSAAWPSHQQDEWHQKWIQRQQQRLKSIVVLTGSDVSTTCEPDREQNGKCKLEEPTRDEYIQEKSPHENEEWYQKWLRRKMSRPIEVRDITALQDQTEKDASCPNFIRQRAEQDTWYTKWLNAQDKRKVGLRTKEVIFVGNLRTEGTVNKDEEGAEAAEAKKQEHAEVEFEDPRKAYEHEEWYQKWLRRQKNKPRQIVELGSERREVHNQAQSNSSDSQVVDAQNTRAQEPTEVQHSSPQHLENERGYENEEWYQKWLRRQKNKAKNIIEIGVDRSHHADTAEAANEHVQGEQSADSTAPQEDKSYQQTDWYQKWLRRQANKSRQIIQIG